jgi:hypothetical protein
MGLRSQTMLIIVNEHFQFILAENKDGHHTSSLLSAKRVKGLLQFESKRSDIVIEPKLTTTLPQSIV